ncbi:MAG: membrane protein insertase YidC [Myxococcota bacterium]
MDRRTLLAMVLSLGIYYGWLWLHPPKPPEELAPEPAPVPAAAPAPAVVSAPAGPTPELVTLPFTFCGTDGKLSTDGGRLHDLTITGSTGPYHVKPLYQWLIGFATGSSETPWLPYGPDPGAAVALGEHATGLATGAGPLQERVPMRVESQSAGRIELVGTSGAGVEIHKVFTERRLEGSCAIDVAVTYTNRGTAPFTGETWLVVGDHVTKAASRYESQREPVALVDGDLTYGGPQGAGCVRQGTAVSDEAPRLALDGPVSWFGLSDRYFGFYVVAPPDPSARARFERLGSGEEAVDGAVYGWSDALAAGASRAASFHVYVGPNNATALEQVDPSLSQAIDLGFWAFFGWPLLWLLRRFHGLLGNWGLSIISLTFLVKLVFFPLTQWSFVAAQKMQQIQPELAKLKEQYADNPTELNQKTMQLMSERKVNPLSGCLPMLLQMPVWIALNQVMLSSVDLYHTEFLYLKDLSSADPYLVLPFAIMGLMWLQQQLTNMATLDPAQQQVMKYMPFIFGLMFFAFPSGLAVYVFVNMTLSIAQQWIIKRTYGGPGGLPATMPLG